MSSEKMKIHADPCTVNCHKVLGGLQMMEVPYDLVHVDYFKAEQKSEANMKINPSATLPFAVVPGAELAITESNAILQYAADAYGKDSFYPKDLHKRAQVNRWLLWESSQWFASCYVYLVEYVVKPLLKAEPDQAVIDSEAPRMHRLCKVLDDQLANYRFLTGDHVTIADIAIASPMHLYAQSKLPFENYPNILRWQQKEMEGNNAWMETQKSVNILVPNCSNGIDPKADPKADGVNGTATSGSVIATFNYTKDIPDDPPTIYFYDHPKADKARAPGDDAVEQTIHDGWDRASEFSIDKEGFALTDFVSKFNDWDNLQAVKEKFYPEVETFLKKETGARRVLVFDSTIRAARNESKKLTQETDTSQRAPVFLCHSDYTHESAPLRVKQLLPEEADTLLQRRCTFINVWKPIRRVVEERPLAMCDVTTTPDADLMKLFLHYRDRIGENYVMRHSKGQKWYYFPRMTPDQSILLKTYDSLTNGTARFVPHTAFMDPTSPPNAPMRESCEIRTICFF